MNATKDSDYNSEQLSQVRCWVWNQNATNAVAMKKMGGLANCTTAKLGAIDAQVWSNKTSVLMTAWYPQDYNLYAGTQKLIHFTYIFQVFVILQLFNQINSRFIQEGEWNIMKGFFSNKMFIAIFVIEWAMQFVMVEIGGAVTKCSPLDTKQNLICLAFGFISIPWGAIIKFFPLKHFEF